MIEKLPPTATPDEVAEAVMQLLGDWFEGTGNKSVILSVADKDCQDPDGNTTTWAAGNPMLQGPQVASVIAGLQPLAKLGLMMTLKKENDGELVSPLMELTKQTMEGCKRPGTLEEFKERYGSGSSGSSFDGLENHEFMEDEDNV